MRTGGEPGRADFALVAVSLLGILIVVAAACGTSSGVGRDDTPVQPAAAQPARFVAETSAGGQLDLGELAGQDVLLWFWAPW